MGLLEPERQWHEISFNEFKDEGTHPSILAEWLNETFGDENSKTLIKIYKANDNDKMLYRLYFWTVENIYIIVLNVQNDKEYLGSFSESRMIYPGEFYTRGSDFPDGPFSKETFDKIMGAIFVKQFKKVNNYEQ